MATYYRRKAEYAEYVLVAAIDFGTTFSGYAFSFRETKENKNLPEQIYMNKDWGEEFSIQSIKTPTSVLVNDKNELQSFGYKAEKQYSEQRDKEHMLHLYRHFKMQLYKMKSARPTVASVEGRLADAITIIGEAIKFIKNHLLSLLATEHKFDDSKLIRWVITVPAIWGDAAKHCMREAAYKAGCMSTLHSEQLIVALEPEAASLCCRRLSVASYEGVGVVEFKKGTKYIILDCGGGTVDITAHELLDSNTVQELDIASGGPWGGTEVDRNIQSLLSSVLGREVLNEYAKEAPQERQEVMIQLEIMKKSIKPGDNSRLQIPIRYSLADVFEDVKEMSIKKWFKTHNKDTSVSFSQGNIVLDHKKSLEMFEEPVQDIVNHVKLLRKKDVMKKLDYIFMVGGFSECEVLQKEMENAFSRDGVKILKPSYAQLAVVKGAVLFGHNPQEIKKRKSRFTYGSAVSVPFNSAIHDAIYKRVDSLGRVRCDDIFRIYVEKGETVGVGSKKEFTVNAPVDSDLESISMLRYDEKPATPAQYINAPGMKEIGHIDINTPRSVKNRGIKVMLEFGGTEMKVSAQFAATGQEAKATMSFNDD